MALPELPIAHESIESLLDGGKISKVERARRELEFACANRARLQAEYDEYCRTLQPPPRVIEGEQLRRLWEVSDWAHKVGAAEQALFGAEHGTPGITGSYGQYQWLSIMDRDITSLLSICPEFVVGNYLAVTRIDCGSLQLTEQEKADGWRSAGKVFQGTSWSPPEYRDDWKIAFSPRITSIHGLPNEAHDECDAVFRRMVRFQTASACRGDGGLRELGRSPS